MKKSSAKTSVIVIIVIILAVIVYFYYEGGSAPSGGSLLSSGPVSEGVGTTELSLLNQIQSLKIDTSIFSDPAYRSLQDYSVIIPTENVGRPDPFAPIPGVLTPGTSQSSGH